MSSDQTQPGIGVKGTVVCLPVRDLEKTLALYRNALGFSDAVIDDGIVAIELPNLSLTSSICCPRPRWSASSSPRVPASPSSSPVAFG